MLSRYRLRFQLQEIDLPPGITILGRSPECRVTIEDPLVSRQHAQITVEANRVVFRDMSSRNGSRVNGVPCTGAVPLHDGDRIRIGTQDLVFCVMDAQTAQSRNRQTGSLLYCAKCRLPRPAEVFACPHCGSQDLVDEDTTLSGIAGDDSASWALLLVVDVIERSVAANRLVDGMRMLGRAAATIDERLQTYGKVDADQFHRLAVAASSLLEAQREPQWVKWIFTTYGRLGLVPRSEVISRLHTIPFEGQRQAIDEILAALQPRRNSVTAEEQQALSLLRQWNQKLGK